MLETQLKLIHFVTKMSLKFDQNYVQKSNNVDIIDHLDKIQSTHTITLLNINLVKFYKHFSNKINQPQLCFKHPFFSENGWLSFKWVLEKIIVF